MTRCETLNIILHGPLLGNFKQENFWYDNICSICNLDEESLLGQWFQDTLSSTPAILSASPQPPTRKKSESGDVGDSGTETTPSGRSFQMAPEEVCVI